MVADPQNNATAMASVTTVRTAGGNILFPVKRHRTVATATADNRDSYFIYKHSKILLCRIVIDS